MSPFRGQTPVPRHQLHITSTTIQSASVSVSWTVSPEVLADVKEREAKGQQAWMMLIVFDKSARSEERKIVPLRDCIAYLSLRTAGEARVFGQVLCGTKRDIYRTWLSHSGRDWEYNSKSIRLVESGFPDSLVHMGYGFVGPDMKLDLQVPKEAFAPSPADWESDWVNYFFITTPRDQCAFRRRRIFAYSLQPVLALAFFALLAAVQAIGLVVAGAKPNVEAWKGLFCNRGSAFSGNLNRDWEKGIGFITLPFLWWLPAIASVIFAKFEWPDVLAMCSQLGPPRGYLIGWACVGAVTVPAAILTGLGAVMLGQKLVAVTKTEKVVERVKAALVFAATPFVRLRDAIGAAYRKLLMLNDEDIDVLSVPWQEGGVYSLDHLPASKRTIKLRFQDLKARVCRPFAR